MSEFFSINMDLIENYVKPDVGVGDKRSMPIENMDKFTELLDASSKKTNIEGYVEKRQELIQKLSTAINDNREKFEGFVNNKDTSYDDGKYYRMRYYITLALAEVNEEELKATCDDDEIMAFINDFNEFKLSDGNMQSGGSGKEIATMIIHILSNSNYVIAKIDDLSNCFKKVIGYMVSGKILEKLKETDEQGGLKIFSGLVDVGVDITESIKKVYNEYDSEKINENIDNKVKNIIEGFKNIDELFKELEDETIANEKEEKNKQIDELVEFVELMKKGVKGSQEYAENMKKAEETQDTFEEKFDESIKKETDDLKKKTIKLKKRKDALQKLAEAKRRLKEAVKEVEEEVNAQAAEQVSQTEEKVSPAGGKRKTKKNKKKMTKSKKHFKKQSRKILKKLSKKKGKKH